MRHTPKHSRASVAERLIERVPRPMRKPLAALTVSTIGLAMVASPMFFPENAQTRASVASVATPQTEVAPATASAPKRPAATPAVSRGEATRTPKKTAAAKSEVVGFYVNWDESSYRSLEKNIDKLTILMPEWYHLDNNGKIRANNPKAARKAMQLIKRKRPDLRVMPIVNNFGGTDDPAGFTKALKYDSTRRKMAKSIVQTMRNGGFQGVNVDFEGLPASARGDLVKFMAILGPMADKYNLEVSQDVIVASKTYDHKRLAKYADYLVPMMYDEHWKGSGPGPIASQGWYTKTLTKFTKLVGPSKVMVAIGSYSYDWPSGGGKARALTYPKARAIARAKKRNITMDKASLNPKFTYKQGRTWRQVWMLDGTTTFNQVKVGTKLGVRGFAVWRMGGEDPTMWKVLKNRANLGPTTAKVFKSDKRSTRFEHKRGLVTRQVVRP